MWDFWWTECQWDRFISVSFGSCPVSIIPPLLHIYSCMMVNGPVSCRSSMQTQSRPIATMTTITLNRPITIVWGSLNYEILHVQGQWVVCQVTRNGLTAELVSVWTAVAGRCGLDSQSDFLSSACHTPAPLCGGETLVVWASNLISLVRSFGRCP